MPGNNRVSRTGLALTALLAACSTPQPTPPAPLAIASTGGPVCHAGPDGGPPPPSRIADRGIGGTGITPTTQIADRGIGGTGIIGVITGFASICLGGREVAYEPGMPIAMDDRAGGITDLRAGQVAFVEAAGPDNALRARRVAIRHEVSGPIDAIEPGGLLRIAGQPVAVAPWTLGDTRPQVGDWTSVSGLRGPDGTIQATRLDRRRPGSARVHGTLLHEGRTWRIGLLEIRFAPSLNPIAGRDVEVEGHWADGVLYADSLSPDLLPGMAFDPGRGAFASYFGGYFGSDVRVLVIDSYAGSSDGRLVLGRSQQRLDRDEMHRSVIEFDRRRDGTLQPASIRDLGAGFHPPNRPQAATTGAAGPGAPSRSPGQNRFQPAPVPHALPGETRGTEAGRGFSGQPNGRTRRNDDNPPNRNEPNLNNNPGFGPPGPAFGPGSRGR